MALKVNSAAVSAFNRALLLVEELSGDRKAAVMAGFNTAAKAFSNAGIVGTPFKTISSKSRSSGGDGGGSSGGTNFRTGGSGFGGQSRGGI